MFFSLFFCICYFVTKQNWLYNFNIIAKTWEKKSLSLFFLSSGFSPSFNVKHATTSTRIQFVHTWKAVKCHLFMKEFLFQVVFVVVLCFQFFFSPKLLMFIRMFFGIFAYAIKKFRPLFRVYSDYLICVVNAKLTWQLHSLPFIHFIVYFFVFVASVELRTNKHE